MSERKYLQLTFVDGEGKRKSFNVPNPKEDLTQTQIETAMDAIILADIFIVGLVAKHSAVVITTTRDDIFG